MSIPSTAVLPLATVIVGVDTHKHVHVAVAIDGVSAKLATCTVSADRAGSAVLVDWARGLGTVEAFGIEGTGSYGVGLASFVRRHAVRVVEVSHCDRRKRRNNGKSGHDRRRGGRTLRARRCLHRCTEVGRWVGGNGTAD